MMNSRASLFRKHIALPQDHGSWVFILSPLLIGLFAGGALKPASINLIVAAMGAFLLRQPVSMAVKAYAGRRSRADLPAARFWMLVYGVIVLVALAGLVAEGFVYILYLAIPGIPVFVWHLYLVSKRAERRQAGIEILATGALSLAAPAAYWIGQGHYDPLGWAIWLLTWMQSAASIVYAYLRLEQRALPKGWLGTAALSLSKGEALEQPSSMGTPHRDVGSSKGIERSGLFGSFRSRYPDLGVRACVCTFAPPNPAPSTAKSEEPRSELWRMGKRAFQYTSFNVALTLVLGLFGFLPRWIFVPYLVQWLETVWGITHPAAGWKPTRIGIRQLVVSILFTVLFIVSWRL